MARIDHNAKANPIAVVFLVLVIMATPLLIAVLPEETGTIVLALALPSALENKSMLLYMPG